MPNVTLPCQYISPLGFSVPALCIIHDQIFSRTRPKFSVVLQ